METEKVFALVEEFENELTGLASVTADIFKHKTNVLVINSAGLESFRNVVAVIKNSNPEIFIQILTHERNEVDIKEICKTNYEVVSYSYNGNFDVSFAVEQLEFLKKKSYELSVVTYNNRYGFGYENMEEVFVQIGVENYYAFNCFNELLKINGTDLHIQTRKTYRSICQWLWKQVESNDWRAE